MIISFKALTLNTKIVENVQNGTAMSIHCPKETT